MLEIKGLSKSYVQGVKAVDNFNITINKGNVLGIIGPNGAGKTTVIKCLTGLLIPDEGTISIDGVTQKKNNIEFKRKISYVAEEIQTFEKITGIEFLNFIADVYKINKKTRVEILQKYLKYFEMEGKITEYIADYSHGMKQKLLLISALLHDSDVLILDEPFTGLDPTAIINLKKVILDYKKQNRIVILSTHLLEMADSICDEMCFVKKGKTLYSGHSLVYKDTKYNSVEEFYNQLINSEGDGMNGI